MVHGCERGDYVEGRIVELRGEEVVVQDCHVGEFGTCPLRRGDLPVVHVKGHHRLAALREFRGKGAVPAPDVKGALRSVWHCS